MSVFDELKGKAGQLKGRAENLVGGNAGKFKGAVGSVGDFIDKKTGGKYAGKVDNLQAKANQLINKAERNRGSEPPAPGGNPSA
ncbi:antitoxin [Arthrobacter sp. I2-34]|uniref:Antitoxin n=1 Tax=Arthrobacter hankyongi TaxID=2904801 RepID=A0ABS9LBJ3_9MICC|nr:antitoxin [Arthrobacter hankyongi]MCG2624054.1 antitoxin [Arthrobacter hankyongi]